MLCFLQDHLDFTQPEAPFEILPSRQIFLEHLHTSLSSFPPSNRYITSHLSLVSIDALVSFFQDLSDHIYGSLQESSTSNLTGPYVLSSSSLLGVVLRTAIAKYELLDFEDICCLYDSYQAWQLGKSTPAHRSVGLIEASSSCLEQCDVYSSLERSHQYYDLHSHAATTPMKEHQQSLVSQTLIYLRAGHPQSALAALDDAVKIAHSRSDHVTIARAMELLYLITLALPASPSASHGEEALLQSIRKYIGIDARVAVSRTLCYLVTRRCGQLGGTGHGTAFSFLSMLLQAAMFGETKSIGAALDANDVDGAWSALATASESALSKAEAPLNSQESSCLVYSSSVAAAQLWMSRQAFDMAILQLQRGLLAMEFATKEEIATVVLLIARLKAKQMLYALLEGRSVADMEGCREAEVMVKGVLEDIQGDAVVAVQRLSRYTELFVKVCGAVVSGDWKGAAVRVMLLQELHEWRTISPEDAYDVEVLDSYILWNAGDRSKARWRLAVLQMNAAANEDGATSSAAITKLAAFFCEA